jgi:hypothetical protein
MFDGRVINQATASALVLGMRKVLCFCKLLQVEESPVP